MYSTSFSIILSVLVGYCTVFSAAAPSKDCFKQERDSYTTTSNTTSRISAPIACSKSANRTCDLPSGGFLNVPSTLSISSTHAGDIFALIGKVVDTEFKKSIYGAVPNTTLTIQPGQTGYMAFTNILVCYDGVIVGSECFDDVAAGTSVTACRPSTLRVLSPEGVPKLDGVAAFVTTTDDTLFDTPDNPAASSTDDSEATPKSTDNPAATTEPNADSRDADSGAVKLLSQIGWWPAMIVTIVMATMGMGGCSMVF